MTRPLVIQTQNLPAAAAARLARHCTVIDGSTPTASTTDTAFLDALARADGVIGNGLAFDAALIERAPRLRVLSSVSVGVDSHDVAALAEHGIVLCHTPDVLTDSVADTALLLMLATARRAIELSRCVREGRWQAGIGPALYGCDVHHRRLGIVGMGRIGEAIATRAAAGFGMTVAYHNRSRTSRLDGMPGLRWQALPELLAESDFVCAVLPLTEATSGLFDAKTFAAMKHGAIFINIGRGATVDEAALHQALSSGALRAAGLDVFAREPLPVDSPLLALDNVVALPHIGSATEATRTAMAERAVDNLLAVLDGRTPPSRYDAALG